MDKFVVVGVDETGESQIALQWAVEAARSRGAAVRVVRSVFVSPVVYWPTIGGEGYMPGPPMDQCRAELDAAVAFVREQLGAAAGSGTLAYEPPATAILEQAEGAELIVLGTKSPHRWQAAVLGSVVTAVTARASCPVAVVRGEQHDGPILVGTDGSADSDEAVGFAFEEADRSGRPLTVVHCWQPTDRHDRPVAETYALLRNWLAERLAQYQQKFPGVSVRTKLIENRPVAALAALTTQATMAVVGSRGRGGVSGLLLGSVSQGLLHHAKCPVVVVRHVKHRR